MTKQIWSGIVAATVCTFAIGLSAQTASPTQQTASPTPPAAKAAAPAAADHITVTGCVERESSSATPGATGTSGSTSPSSSGFVLNVKPDSAAPSSSATAGTSGAPSSYRLDADDSKLSSHVGHKVEITGTLDKAMSGSTAPAGSTSTASASSSAPKLKVDSVKMIAASCAE